MFGLKVSYQIPSIKYLYSGHGKKENALSIVFGYILFCFVLFFLVSGTFQVWCMFLSKSDRERLKEFHIKRKQSSKIINNQRKTPSPKLKQYDITARGQNAPGSSTDNLGF